VLIQPAAPALHARLPLPDRVRATAHRARPTGGRGLDFGQRIGHLDLSKPPSDGLTTRRVSTAGVDFAPHASISPENDSAAQTGPAQAAATAVKGTNRRSWPLRGVVNEQAR
jgi:hypothetical protein